MGLHNPTSYKTKDYILGVIEPGFLCKQTHVVCEYMYIELDHLGRATFPSSLMFPNFQFSLTSVWREGFSRITDIHNLR